MRLHDIGRDNKKYVAVTWRGGNGRVIGRHPYLHLIAVERTTPPPIRIDRTPWNTGRRYWSPYTTPIVDVTAALCGGFPTRARHQTPENSWGMPTAEQVCPDCRARAGNNWTTIRELNRTDPFLQIPLFERDDARDPVTGL